jgi:hypothetical protein
MVRSKETKSKTGARAGARTGTRSPGTRSPGTRSPSSRSPSSRSPGTRGRSATGSSRTKVAAAAGRKKSAAAPRRRASSSPGISRIDQEATRTHGFFVRVGYERTAEGTWRPRHRAFFGDASYGGKTKALRAAKEWLAEVTEQD